MLDDLDEVVPELEAQLEAFGAGTERNLLITGHSLGATLSGLSAARLAADGFNVSGAPAPFTVRSACCHAESMRLP